MGCARGGIVVVSGDWDVEGISQDAIDDAWDAEQEVEVCGGTFPTYPHCPEAVINQWRENNILNKVLPGWDVFALIL